MNNKTRSVTQQPWKRGPVSKRPRKDNLTLEEVLVEIQRHRPEYVGPHPTIRPKDVFRYIKTPLPQDFMETKYLCDTIRLDRPLQTIWLDSPCACYDVILFASRIVYALDAEQGSLAVQAQVRDSEPGDSYQYEYMSRLTALFPVVFMSFNKKSPALSVYFSKSALFNYMAMKDVSSVADETLSRLLMRYVDLKPKKFIMEKHLRTLSDYEQQRSQPPEKKLRIVSSPAFPPLCANGVDAPPPPPQALPSPSPLPEEKIPSVFLWKKQQLLLSWLQEREQSVEKGESMRLRMVYSLEHDFLRVGDDETPPMRAHLKGLYYDGKTSKFTFRARHEEFLFRGGLVVDSPWETHRSITEQGALIVQDNLSTGNVKPTLMIYETKSSATCDIDILRQLGCIVAIINKRGCVCGGYGMRSDGAKTPHKNDDTCEQYDRNTNHGEDSSSSPSSSSDHHRHSIKLEEFIRVGKSAVNSSSSSSSVYDPFYHVSQNSSRKSPPVVVVMSMAAFVGISQDDREQLFAQEWRRVIFNDLFNRQSSLISRPSESWLYANGLWLARNLQSDFRWIFTRDFGSIKLSDRSLMGVFDFLADRFDRDDDDDDEDDEDIDDYEMMNESDQECCILCCGFHGSSNGLYELPINCRGQGLIIGGRNDAGRLPLGMHHCSECTRMDPSTRTHVLGMTGNDFSSVSPHDTSKWSDGIFVGTPLKDNAFCRKCRVATPVDFFTSLVSKLAINVAYISGGSLSSSIWSDAQAMSVDILCDSVKPMEMLQVITPHKRALSTNLNGLCTDGTVTDPFITEANLLINALQECQRVISCGICCEELPRRACDPVSVTCAEEAKNSHIREIALIHCGHCLCFECLLRLQKPECPFCKAIFDQDSFRLVDVVVPSPLPLGIPTSFKPPLSSLFRAPLLSEKPHQGPHTPVVSVPPSLDDDDKVVTSSVMEIEKVIPPPPPFHAFDVPSGVIHGKDHENGEPLSGFVPLYLFRSTHSPPEVVVEILQNDDDDAHNVVDEEEHDGDVVEEEEEEEDLVPTARLLWTSQSLSPVREYLLSRWEEEEENTGIKRASWMRNQPHNDFVHASLSWITREIRKDFDPSQRILLFSPNGCHHHEILEINHNLKTCGFTNVMVEYSRKRLRLQCIHNMDVLILLGEAKEGLGQLLTLFRSYFDLWCSFHNPNHGRRTLHIDNSSLKQKQPNHRLYVKQFVDFPHRF